jgi:hypothetical protein
MHKAIKAAFSFVLLPSSFFLPDEKVCGLALATKEEGRGKNAQLNYAQSSVNSEAKPFLSDCKTHSAIEGKKKKDRAALLPFAICLLPFAFRNFSQSTITCPFVVVRRRRD